MFAPYAFAAIVESLLSANVSVAFAETTLFPLNVTPAIMLFTVPVRASATFSSAALIVRSLTSSPNTFVKISARSAPSLSVDIPFASTIGIITSTSSITLSTET